MQGEHSWKNFGESLRVTNDFISHCEDEAPHSTLLKTKQIDIYQNHKNIIKNRLNKPKRANPKNSSSG